MEKLERAIRGAVVDQADICRPVDFSSGRDRLDRRLEERPFVEHGHDHVHSWVWGAHALESSLLKDCRGLASAVRTIMVVVEETRVALPLISAVARAGGCE